MQEIRPPGDEREALCGSCPGDEEPLYRVHLEKPGSDLGSVCGSQARCINSPTHVHTLDSIAPLAGSQPVRRRGPKSEEVMGKFRDVWEVARATCLMSEPAQERSGESTPATLL